MGFSESVDQLVQPISRNYGPTSVSARELFLSYNSVMTLAYEGFSRTLLDIKRHVINALGWQLGPENLGSKWPKTTLGCLNDGVELTLDEVFSLRALVDDYDGRILCLSEEERRIPIPSLQVVRFACRTLERRVQSTEIRLLGRVLTSDEPPDSHLRLVDEVMSGFGHGRLRDYYNEGLAPKGRTIDAYYRAPHEEMTLVADTKLSPALRGVVCDFQTAVDAALPGKYTWFDPKSWHMTVRALIERAVT